MNFLPWNYIFCAVHFNFIHTSAWSVLTETDGSDANFVEPKPYRTEVSSSYKPDKNRNRKNIAYLRTDKTGTEF